MKNIQLRLIEKNDAFGFFQLMQANKAWLSMYFPGTLAETHDLASTEIFVQRKLKEAAERKEFFSVILKDATTIIGCVTVKEINWKIPKCELGYFVDEREGGKGIITFAVRKIIASCFEDYKMNKIFVRIGRDNVASKKIALKNGFELEGILRKDHKTISGELVDVEYYGLLSDS